MLLLYSSVLHQIPKCIYISISLSHFSSQTVNPIKSPPRKGIQAVRRIINLLSSYSPQSQNPNLCEALKSLQASPQTISPSQASTLITAISNPLISFDFYRFLKSSKPIFKPDSILFSSLIQSQLHSTNPQIWKIRYFFDEMKKHKVFLSLDDFRTFLKFSVSDYFEIAEFLVWEVLEGIEFDEGSYNYVISVYAEFGLCKEAILVAERARARSRNPSLGFYSSLMDVYRKNEDAREAMKLFLEMEERGVLADEGIYRVLLEILCRVGWMKLCWVTLEEMKKVGCRPDECLAMNLMRRFIKEDMVSEAGYFFQEGILKNTDSLAVFVEAVTEKQGPGVAFELVKDMRESGFDVDGCVYASLIRGCGKIGLIDNAEKIFSDIKISESIKNLELVSSSMIYVYSRVEMRELAERIWGEMEATMGFRGSEETFLYMMSMYGTLGLVGEVVKMFDQWKKSGCCVNVDAYVVLVDALSKSGKLNQARDCLLEMKMSGLHPTNSIYAFMMEGYLLVGLINHAVALFDEYKMSGLEVDEVVASSVLRILIQAGQLSELGFYLDKLTRQGIKISRDKGTLLMEICTDDSCLRKLIQLLQ